jgi:hypothetical protein
VRRLKRYGESNFHACPKKEKKGISYGEKNINFIYWKEVLRGAKPAYII